MMETFKLPAIRTLAAQLERGPRRLRLRQLYAIEFLLSVVQNDRDYPFDFVCHALTGYRRSAGVSGDRLLPGEDLVSDLVSLAEFLSADADIPVQTCAEPTFAVQDLADRFDVSTKTIFRWRRRGLTGWRLRFPDRRLRLMFPERCVRRFVANNADLVARGSSFSQLTKRERQQIIDRARTLAEDNDATVNAVARTISTEMGRAVETVRLILKHHDDAHPRCGIFNRSALQLDGNDQRLAVWEAYVDGTPVEDLARRFGRPATWVYRTITEMRARELRARKIEFVDSDEFTTADAPQSILATPDFALRQPLTNGRKRVPADLPPYLAQLFAIPLLTPAGERHLFRKMNFLKWQADQLRQQIDPETARAAALDRVEEVLAHADSVKQELVQANLRLVVGIAKRHVSATIDLFELISDGNMSLMRAVDKFDYSRGFKFSTYATWAIMKNFARSVPEHHVRRERYQSGWDEMLSTSIAWDEEESDSEEMLALRNAVERMLDTLDDREQAILRERYGLDDHGQPRTLEQIGNRFGVSKERIRQLEARAITKLRTDFSAEAERLVGQ